MSFRTIQRVSLLLLLVACALNSFAQSRRGYNNISYTSIYYSPHLGDFYYSLGLHTSKYDGDFGGVFGESKTTQKSAIRYSLNVGYQVTNYVSLRFDVTRYKFKEVADVINTLYDTTRFKPFNTVNMDYSINLIHDLFPKGEIDNGERRYTPYGILGLGFTTQNSTVGESGGFGLIVPIGVGFKYYIFHNLNIAFEARGAIALSDKIDGVKAGKTKDTYVNFGFKATWQKSYKFDYKQYKKKFYHL